MSSPEHTGDAPEGGSLTVDIVTVYGRTKGKNYEFFFYLDGTTTQQYDYIRVQHVVRPWRFGTGMMTLPPFL